MPGRNASKTNVAQDAQTIDIMPTLLELCDLSVPDTVQGRSLKPILDGNSDTLADNAAVIETDANFFGRPCLGIRTPSHLYGMKLTEDARHIEQEAAWFFDLGQDPYEMNNLVETGGQATLATELRVRLRDGHVATPWLADGGEAGPLREPPFLAR